MGKYPAYVVDKFWKKVVKGDYCWIWKASTTRAGYGQMQAREVSQAPMLTHRISWELANGPIPEGMHVLHKCDNPPCVNPEHLFLGTQRDNNHDRHQKGRTASGDANGARTNPQQNPFIRDGGSGLRGSDHPMARLTKEQVLELRSLFAAGLNRSEIAKKFGISVTHVYRIAKGVSWRNGTS